MAKKLPKTSHESAPLSGHREEAAQLVAAGRLTLDEIAERMNVTRRQLYTWRQQPEFTARIDAINAAFAEETGRYAIAQRARRLASMDDRYRRLHHIIEDRAAALADESGLTDPLGLGMFRSAALAAGFDTGLVTLEWATTPKGGFKPQFKVDVGLSAEMRALEKQAAQERGEWVDKVAPTDPKGEKAYTPTPVNYSRLSEKQVNDYESILATLLDEGGGPGGMGSTPGMES
jgi:transposase-like protein